jgi:hypothetical protein
LLIAALNGLEVLRADVQNAFLTAPNKEKCWIKAGPESGDNQGKVYIVTRALYGLKSAGASFRVFTAKCVDDMGFKSCPADPDVWMQPVVKSDGETYYEYVMTYIDDLIPVRCNPKGIMDEIQETFKFTDDKVEKPSNYLGARLQKKRINGIDCWTITSVDYIDAAVTNVEKTIEGTQWKMPIQTYDTNVFGVCPRTAPELPQNWMVRRS